MTIEINGDEKCVIYHLHYIGGPRDGDVVNAFRPYWQMKCGDDVYRAKEKHPDHLIWVDDFTRRIELHFITATLGGCDD